MIHHTSHHIGGNIMSSILVTLTPSVQEQLQSIAKQRHLPLSQLLSQIASDYVNDYANNRIAYHNDSVTDEQAWQIIKARMAKADMGIGRTIDSAQARRQIHERLQRQAIAKGLIDG